ncbi:cysteine desulfurase family protein [Allokutzneria multivorans]|uniref:Cysteine desulfurase family protein n=1 Tax=Allokutzneria multivorans TaxID=1142134 RepID=A0ABP7TMV4_9PSEU
MTYLDHAATTPMLPEAVAAMTEALPVVGNASSLHASGRRARRAVEEARESLAAALGAHPSEVIFTGGGTEGDNLALKGIFWSRRAADPRRVRVLVSAVEHHAVLDSADWLAEHQGAVVETVPVDSVGRVLPEALAELIDRDPESVALVSVMWANNEVGTVNAIRELVEVAHARGVPLHTDAVQAVGMVPVDFAACGANALVLTGHKLGGPVGFGALLLRRDTACTPVQHGGGQEREVRSGTLGLAGIVGLATAVRHVVASQPGEAARLRELRAELTRGVLEAVPDAVLNGDSSSTLPGTAHFTFPGCEGDSLLMLLDSKGIECSTGSACTAGVAQPSHVLLAMGADRAAARGSLRFSLGHTSTAEDVAAVVAAIGPAVEQLRGAGRRRIGVRA